MNPGNDLWVRFKKGIVLIAKALRNDTDWPGAAGSTWRMVCENHIRNVWVLCHIAFKRH